MKAAIKAVIPETPQSRTFVVRLEQPVSFATGQCMRWILPGVSISRLFSIASPGGDNISELEFTIRVNPPGRFTSHLGKLRAGDSIELQGPFGHFRFKDADPGDVALIAGGSGISVLRSILLHVLESNQPRFIKLLFSVRGADDVIYRQQLADLADEHKNFSYTVTVTGEAGSWDGYRGRIDQPMLDKEFGALRPTFYLCGPPQFISDIESLLQQAGVTEERINIDRWKFN